MGQSWAGCGAVSIGAVRGVLVRGPTAGAGHGPVTTREAEHRIRGSSGALEPSARGWAGADIADRRSRGPASGVCAAVQ